MSDEVAVRETSLLDVIADAVRDKTVDVDKMERLFALQERYVAEKRRSAYVSAMARIVPSLPVIKKNGLIAYESRGSEVKTYYAKLEDMDKVLRPILGAEGLSQSYDSEESGSKIKVTLRVTHCEGHFEEKSITGPIHKSGAMNDIQAVKSSVSYLRRILTEMFFNLIEEGTDVDGNDLETISAEQVKDLETQIQDIKMDKGRFLVFMKVGKLEEILLKDLAKAQNGIDVKRRGA